MIIVYIFHIGHACIPSRVAAVDADAAVRRKPKKHLTHIPASLGNLFNPKNDDKFMTTINLRTKVSSLTLYKRPHIFSQ